MNGGDLAPGTQIALVCPACGDEIPGSHEVLKADVPATVRCLTCRHVHKARVDEVSTLPVRVVVSMDGESISTMADVPRSEQLAVGEEFVVDTDDAILGVRITTLELDDERRVDVADATAVETIWTRAVDNVAVNATIHPADGGRTATRSEKVPFPGDEPVTVGDSLDVGDDPLTVRAIRLRDDAIGYDRRQLDRAGEHALAKDIKRLYARIDPGDGWRSPWDA